MMKRKTSNWLCALATVLGMVATSSFAQDTGGGDAGVSANADANNPLANVTAFNIQNYSIFRFTGLDEDINGNQFVMRYARPLSFGNSDWLLRASLPYNSFPVDDNFQGVNGIGDADIFLAYQFDTQPGISFGLGPQLVLPTATDGRLGTEQWQLGLANVFFDGRSPKVQYGYLLIWRAGLGEAPDGRDSPNLGALQPFAFYQLGDGWYTGGAPIWTYDFNNDNYNVPLGLRIGKVQQFGNTTANFFVEPQWSIAYEGDGQPEFQIYAAVNLQFR